MPEYKTRSSTYDNSRLLLIKDVKLMDSGVFGYTSSSTRESHGVLLSVMGKYGLFCSGEICTLQHVFLYWEKKYAVHMINK